ncbi:hypothetical protein HMPREF0322_03842 [Desulfitobacterium hafniense DP7]|uniref:Uncharacterized protein n=1 Tax=Desulfitobacterium hafniense DP7 TaxID=537010 RepID=G9XS93_DESHA|nr:hypothetical protein HMPREF0322_03842 [Desulfitobacterium hafniense DP7]
MKSTAHNENQASREVALFRKPFCSGVFVCDCPMKFNSKVSKWI